MGHSSTIYFNYCIIVIDAFVLISYMLYFVNVGFIGCLYILVGNLTYKLYNDVSVNLYSVIVVSNFTCKIIVEE